MAILSGDNFTKAATPTSENVLSPGTLGGRVRVLTEEITLAAAAIGDFVQLGRELQAGAIILGVELVNAALGAGVTLDVGDSDTEDRYMSAVDGSVAGVKRDLNQAGFNYKIGSNDGDSVVRAKIEGGVATGLVKVNILYTED